jgi:16S rRNA C967 or C1407 C5-methylase (RsmB/RsmF family)
VIANDADAKRSFMLVHQTLRRLCTPNILVTNHDAAQFPSIMLQADGARPVRFICVLFCVLPNAFVCLYGANSANV